MTFTPVPITDFGSMGANVASAASQNPIVGIVLVAASIAAIAFYVVRGGKKAVR